MVFRPGLSPEFCRRIAGHVDLAAEPGLGFPQGGRKVRQSGLADHQKIDIAPCMLLAACDRPIDERASDPPLGWTEEVGTTPAVLSSRPRSSGKTGDDLETVASAFAGASTCDGFCKSTETSEYSRKLTQLTRTTLSLPYRSESPPRR